MAANTIASKTSLVLDLPPSCVQFCQPHPSYFVIGTYNLQKDEDAGREVTDAEAAAAPPQKPQSRNGSLLVFQTHGTSFTHVQTEQQPSALLDVRFHPAPGKQEILAAVSSTGTLAIFRLEPTQDAQAPLMHIATSRCEDLPEDVLFLQCCWHPSDPQVIGVTLSTGAARLLRLDEAWKIANFVDLDIQNSLEAWSIAMAPAPADNSPDSITVYCGGDDSILRYNSYSGIEDGPSGGPLFAPVDIKGQHDAGVTAILPLALHEPDGSRLVVTGSYDDCIRLFSICDPQVSYGMKKVKLLAQENLEGGVWRLDLVDMDVSGDSKDIRILASCMHAGARLIRLSRGQDGFWACAVLARFDEHKSMNYGSAIMPPKEMGRTTHGPLTCISTSFYDKLLCLWEYKAE